MLVLFETPAGYAIFKLLKEKKLVKPENLFKEFETVEKSNKLLKLIHFEKFKDMEDALSSATSTINGKMSKSLKKCLKGLFAEGIQEQLAVGEAKLGGHIAKKLKIECTHNAATQELMRCIRGKIGNLLEGLTEKDLTRMALGVSHGLSRYKIKFNPQKIDKMVIEAINALDEMDKEINNYVMRCKEWYGWHFPELSKLIADNTLYLKIVVAMGFRDNAVNTDFSSFLSEEEEQKVKTMAEISMGTEIMEDDLYNMQTMCQEVLNLQECRTHLYEYLKNRMAAVAPNVTALVGEIVGARLISHAGSLVNLAKAPASTVQIFGAEKALFRALKARHDTPKYGLIYHAHFVGQSSAANRGRVSRMLAGKTALAARVDALADDDDCIDIGTEQRAKLEKTLRWMEENKNRRISGTGRGKSRHEKYENKSKVFQYKSSGDSSLPSKSEKSFGKRKFEKEEYVSNKKVKVEVKDEE
ncbi:nucleolar protein 58 [Caerostris extrusa]|uniref:Nucleolar protein 58 n=1 Tax=Caerostris extrusa TaxID=172846 RepID=A0AAV4N1A5_CAEEX|nr:nucleolar protein 58 [Caerostris extrusa]